MANSDVFVAFLAFHLNTSNQESGGIFEHQNLTAKPSWLTCFAAFIDLSVQLENAEQFVAV